MNAINAASTIARGNIGAFVPLSSGALVTTVALGALEGLGALPSCTVSRTKFKSRVSFSY